MTTTPTPDPDAAALAAACRRRLNAAVLLERAALAASVGAAAVATAWIAAKAFAPDRHDLALLALGVVPAAALAAAWRARARGELFSHREALVLADVLRRNDAELPARVERPDLFAGPLAPAAQRMPRVRWTTPLRSLGPAAVYLGLVALLPVSAVRVAPATEILDMQLAELTERLDEAPLAPEEREELIRDITELREEPRAMDRAQWEAVETVRERLEGKMAEALGELALVEGATAGLEAALARIEAGDAPAGLLGELAGELEAAAARLAKVDDPKLRAAMERAASQCRGAAGKGSGRGLSAADSAALRDALDDLKEKLSKCRSKCGGGKYTTGGRGSVSRGRGDAELTLSEEAREIDATTDPKALAREFDDQSYEIGVHHVAPEEGAVLPARSTTLEAGAATGPGGDVRRTRVSPAGREVIQRYFSDAPAPTTPAAPAPPASSPR